MEKSFYSYWGKASQNEQTGDYNFHLLAYHSLDAAAVGTVLLNEHLELRNYFSNFFQSSAEQTVKILTLSLMLHDVGKFSKTFQSLIDPLFSRLFPDKKIKTYEIKHDTLGFLLWREIIKNKVSDINKSLSKFFDYFIRASFGHHGYPPLEHNKKSILPFSVNSFFDFDDIEAALIYFEACMEIVGSSFDLPAIDQSTKSKIKQISWIIAGFNVIADWVSSDVKYFEYKNTNIDLSDYWNEFALPQAKRAVNDIKWKPCKASSIPNSNIIKNLFPFIKEKTPLQELVTNINTTDGPELFIIEDVTGAGKTEAAMTLLSRLMRDKGATGAYIALPTKATANAMYERMSKAYARLYAESESPSLILSHGSRHLSPFFSQSLVIKKQKSDSNYESEESASAMCNTWYADNRKKAILADIGIGTIDQILLGILPAKHQSLRLLGLQGKILIVDEVHAYDTYMNHLLEVLLKAHAQGGGSAILLSATIPMEKRTSLVNSFLSGIPDNEEKKIEFCSDAFPLITYVNKSNIEEFQSDTRDEVKRDVSVKFFNSSKDIYSFIEEKALAGKAICWIRNTVNDAKESYQSLIDRDNLPENNITLFHSRFAMIDRNRIEQIVLKIFGKESNALERSGRVLIATQVIEQSLDLDFDEMITDIAPIDLIVQRAGRLHRHVRDDKGNLCNKESAVDRREPPVIHVFALEFDKEAGKTWITEEFHGTAAVYQDLGILWRTQKILEEKKGWTMPVDSRYLIESVYGEQNKFEIPEGLFENVLKATGINSAKKATGVLSALVLEQGYSRKAVQMDEWDEDEKIKTRLSEESVEIVLAVPDNKGLTPYAGEIHYAWDQSSLSISLKAWENLQYKIPDEYKEYVDKLKNTEKRLKFSEIFIVGQTFESATRNNQWVSTLYHPKYGWGGAVLQGEYS